MRTAAKEKNTDITKRTLNLFVVKQSTGFKFVMIFHEFIPPKTQTIPYIIVVVTTLDRICKLTIICHKDDVFKMTYMHDTPNNSYICAQFVSLAEWNFMKFAATNSLEFTISESTYIVAVDIPANTSITGTWITSLHSEPCTGFITLPVCTRLPNIIIGTGEVVS
jgi:hypothetical protein